MRLRLLLVAALLGITCFAPSFAGEGKIKIGIATMFPHPYWDVMTNGVREAMGDRYDVIELVSNYNSEEQVNQVDDLIAQGVKGIFIEPFDGTAIKTALEACKTANIPVVILDAPPVDTDLVTAMVTTDNHACGVVCAKDLIERMAGKDCNVVILGQPGVESGRLRQTGFADTLKDVPNFRVIADQDYGGQQDKATNIMENIVQANAKIDAVFAINENGIFAAIAVLEGENRLSGTCLYSVNGASAEIDMIRMGKQTGTAAQLPHQMGYQGGEVMLEILEKGEPGTFQVLIEPLLVTADNGNLQKYEPAY
ncbi:MAG: substrate-binding domain-containing protein [Planctomycetes bacterium]|nr:substrate-binding domain-containing protein [Planctomycetota bacterium]